MRRNRMSLRRAGRNLVGLLLGLLLALSFVHCAEAQPQPNGGTGWYLTAGLAVHANGIDCPESCMSNPLANFGAGYTWRATDQLYIDGYINHESSIPDTEEGGGLNKAGIQGRWYFK